MISQKALEKFKILWREEYGEEIPDDLALDEALNLLTIMDKTYRPIKKEWIDEIEEKSASP